MSIQDSRGYAATGIQEIKYDCLACLKEFESLPGGWLITLTDEPEEAIGKAGLRDANSPWMSRAAISGRAARTVADFLCMRFGGVVSVQQEATAGRVIILYKETTATRGS